MIHLISHHIALERRWLFRQVIYFN